VLHYYSFRSRVVLAYILTLGLLYEGRGFTQESPHQARPQPIQKIPKIRTFPAPPADFRALNATDQERDKYGIPRPPKAESGPGYAAWREVFSRSLRFVAPKYRVDGAATKAKRRGGAARILTGLVESQQLAGISDTSTVGYDEAFARWLVPTPSTNGSSLVTISASNANSLSVSLGTTQNRSCTSPPNFPGGVPAYCPGPTTFGALVTFGFIFVPFLNFPVNPGDVMMGFLESGFGGGDELIATIIDLNLNIASSISLSYSGSFTTVQFGVQRPYQLGSCGRFLCPTPGAFSAPWATWLWDMQVCTPGQLCSGAVDQSSPYKLLYLTDPDGTVLQSVHEYGTTSVLSQHGVTDQADSWALIVIGEQGLESGDFPQ
jgi:hypothetical protein